MNSSENVKRWRKNFKQKVVKAMGGRCCVCGYNRYIGNLTLHHIDPSQKERSISDFLSRPRKWEIVVDELKKCTMVCLNCHNELHAGITKLPENPPMFDSNSNIDEEMRSEMDVCPVCGKPKSKQLITCSRSCAAKKKMVIAWDKIDLPKLLQTKAIVRIAEELGCSDMAVRKRMKKMGITK